MTRGWAERWLAASAGRLLDLVYPGVCQLCDEPTPGGAGLCRDCRAGLPGLGDTFCAGCGERFDGAIDEVFQCPNCRGQDFAFAFARPALRRSEGAMTLVHGLKYERRLHLARELGRLACRAFDEDRRLDEARAGGWPLVPVPLFWKRRRWRQFNQAAEIARETGRRLGLPVVPALRRIRSGESQTRLTRAQRLQNLRGAFRPTRRLVPGPGAVLIDDVFTTGATSHECARTLRRAGIQKVVVVTAMRG